jgi:hypothetical protein
MPQNKITITNNAAAGAITALNIIIKAHISQ